MHLALVLSLASVLASPVIPAHGTVLAITPKGTIIRNDPVTGMLPSQTRVYRVSPSLTMTTGDGIDGFIDRSTQPWRWYEASLAGTFIAGLPDKAKVKAIDYGAFLPATRLIDQQGHFVDLSAIRKVTLVSFIFTRCKDECPLITSKFVAMQQQLDPAHFHLVEITIDPVYDSPAVIARYARQFSANPRSFSILTGQPHEIAQLLNRFGISSLQNGDANFIHNDKVFLSAPDGRVAQVVQTSGFTPGSMVAQAQHLAGQAGNPFGRFQLWLIASVTALCGGNQFAGIVALETVLFLIIAAISFVLLAWVARRLWRSA